LGLNSVFFLKLVYGQLLAIRRPNRAAVDPIGQHDPPGPLKLLDLRKKHAKKTPSLFHQKHSIFSVCMYFLVRINRLLPAVFFDEIAVENSWLNPIWLFFTLTWSNTTV
jgi:hypothetical protein